MKKVNTHLELRQYAMRQAFELLQLRFMHDMTKITDNDLMDLTDKLYNHLVGNEELSDGTTTVLLTENDD